MASSLRIGSFSIHRIPLEDGQEVHVKEVNNPLALAATAAPAPATQSAPGKRPLQALPRRKNPDAFRR